MKNIIDIGGYKAVVAYDPDLGLFVGGSDGADGLGGGGGGGSGKSSAYSAGRGGNGLVLLRYALKPLFVIAIQ